MPLLFTVILLATTRISNIKSRITLTGLGAAARPSLAGEAAALLPLTATCRAPWALAQPLTSTNRQGVVRSRKQRGVAGEGPEGELNEDKGARRTAECEKEPSTHKQSTTSNNDNDDKGPLERRATTNPGSAAPVVEEAAHREL